MTHFLTLRPANDEPDLARSDDVVNVAINLSDDDLLDPYLVPDRAFAEIAPVAAICPIFLFVRTKLVGGKLRLLCRDVREVAGPA